MKCHYVTYQGERVLIPGCMSVAVSNNIENCCCPKNDKNEKTIEERILALEKKVNKLIRQSEKSVQR